MAICVYEIPGKLAFRIVGAILSAMRIKNVELKNFRNITKADISFGDINVFTGRNSSGKSNFLLALSNILKTKNEYTSEFGSNNVTIGAGRKTTTFKVLVERITSKTYFLGSDGPKRETDFFCVEPESMAFEKILDKNSFSVTHKLSFTGKQYTNKDGALTWQEFDKSNKFDEKAERIVDELVYEKKFSRTEVVGEANVVQTDPIKNKNESRYFALFQSLQHTLVSQIKPKLFNVDLGQITTALSIHKYVTEKGNEQIYQEALKRLKIESMPSTRVSMENSEFVFLVADIQRNATIKKKYNNDLNLYTKGIVKDISISSKGVLTVESPNGPDGIWTISNGTSVLVFFITLINWVNLHKDQRSYQLPHVILLDETDSIIHPTIQSEFIEVLRSLSRKVQIFITTHSPYFLDGFSTEEIYYIKDSASIAEHSPEGVNRCNIYNYKSIIEKLSKDQQKEILEKRNSELFCEGIIENLFPVSEV